MNAKDARDTEREIVDEFDAPFIEDSELEIATKPFPPRENEQIETQSDPFNRLVLNPGADTDASTNPLCPDCGEPIVPWANQYERRYICGCEENKRFSFDRVSNDVD